MVDREHLLESLIAFVCERTGLSSQDVRAVFDADQEFWAHHQTDARTLMREDEEA